MRSILLYAESMLLTLVIVFASLDLRHANMRVPLYYSMGSDVHFILGMIKSIADNGWYFENPWLGAPGTLKIYDFPFAETGTFLGVKLFLLVFRDPYLAGNLFYLATYVLAAWSALFVSRKLGADGQVAVATGLLFTFTPYHFWRGMAHLHLSAYYPIPLVVMVSLWLCQGLPLFLATGERGRLRPGWHAGRTLPVLVTALLVSLGGPYSAYFGTFLLIVGGLIGLLRRPGLDRAMEAIVCVGLVAGLFLLQLLPFVIGSHRQGRVQTTVKRTMDDYHVHALHLENLIRPTVGHRLPWMGQLSTYERDVSPSDLPSLLVQFGEARLCTPLGLFGSLGLFFLIAAALASPFPLTERQPAVRDLGKLCVASLLLCLFGGLGEVIAAHVTTMIRCYNRISIYISFFACLAAALLATRPATGATASDRKRRQVSVFLVWGVTLLALLDQIPSGATPDHRRDAAQFLGDQQFIRRIEQAIPPGSMVFQLPVVPFPEGGTRESMEDYSHFRGYAHSHTVRWSYGAMKGRDVAGLQDELATLDPAGLVGRLQELGFAGIYINRKGLTEQRRKDLEWLLRVVPQVPILSQVGDLIFLRLPEGAAGTGRGRESRPRAMGAHPAERSRSSSWMLMGLTR